MAEARYFICYSPLDGGEIAVMLADRLIAGPPSIPVWVDQRDLQPGVDRYAEVVQALKDCRGVLYLVTGDSADPNCPCTQEWIRALKYKKAIIPLMFNSEAELPFRLEPREPVRFAESVRRGARPTAGTCALARHAGRPAAHDERTA